MARQFLNPKRRRDATWFRDKSLLVEAQRNGKFLNEEELEFLADPKVAKGHVTQTVTTHNAGYQADDLDVYDSDCDDFSTAKPVLMANLSSYGSYVLSEIPHSENTHTDMLNQRYKFSAQQDAMILSVFEQMSHQATNYNKVNKDNLMANESLSAELERYKERSAQTVYMLMKPQVFYDYNLKQALGFQDPFYLKKAQQIRPVLYDGSVIARETNLISIVDSEETLMLKEENFGKRFVPQRELSDKQALHSITDQSASSPAKIKDPRELPKVSLVNTSLTKLKYHLGQFDNVVKKWITTDVLTEGEYGMTSLADKEILSGVDNRPPMLEKDMYDTWKRIMELYMLNRQHGRMILESVEDGPLLWPTVKEKWSNQTKEIF
nr:hypothetical protein [Tanacetum cinerariifolium]